MKLKHIIPVILLLLATMHIKADVHFIMKHHQGSHGSQVTVPIRVKDFQDIISIQGTIEFDPSIISYISVQDFALPDMNFNNFGTNQSANGIITFSWFDNLLNGNTVVDSAVIFSLTFDITGNLGQVSPLSFINTPTVIEVINANLNQENVTIANGSFTVQNLGGQQVVGLFTDTITAPANAQVIVAARVRDFININSFQGTMEFNPAIISFAGFAGFGLPNLTAANFGLSQTSNGKLMFSWHDTAFAGIDLPDSTAVFSMIFDLIGTPGQQSQLTFVNIPTPIELTDSLNNVLVYNISSGFIQINNINTNALTIMVDTVIGSQGFHVDVPVRGIHFNSIVSMQGTIAFNTAIATFDTISYYGLSGMDFSHFGTTQAHNGLLMYSWSDPSQTGVSIADSSILFTMRFTLIGIPGSYTLVDFVNAPTPLECADNTFTPVNTQYISGKAIVSGDASVVIDEATNNAYCAGDILSISYTANGIFIAGNQFILQLSDATGSFANPTNLDTIISIISGVFNAQIPLNTFSGTGYLLRIISTNPSVISNETNNPITIHDIPATPILPHGDVLICENPLNTTYTTYGVQGALLYNWTIFPINAGVLTATDTLVTVDWNNGFTGSAYIKVSASNNLCFGNYSDSLEVVILPYPITPDKPTGDTLLCLNPTNSSYIVYPVSYATNYVWTLYPQNAGSLIPNNNTAIVDWNDTFTGTAYIKVFAENDICIGPFSDSLAITVLNYPATPDKPDGDTLLCINPPDKLYSTNAVSGAISYVWELLPANAGTLTSYGTSVLVDWNSTFSGTASIKVKALNQICESVFSDVLNIDIVIPFSAPNIPFGGNTAFCINSPNASYYTYSMQGATDYIWGIYPSNAATLISNDTIVTIDWEDTFTGTVYVFVSATNGVCNGISSDSLTINIYPIPAPPVVNDTSICYGMTSPIISASGTGSIQWYDNCVITPPAVHIGNTFNPQQTAVGSYNYCVTQTLNGCESTSVQVTFSIHETPDTPIKPIGDTLVCQSATGTYVTQTVFGADSYIWHLNPPTAGTLSQTDTSVVINWDSGFSGTAFLSVNAANQYCLSIISDSLQIFYTSYPQQPLKPQGDTIICEGSSISVYSSFATGSDSYNWVLEPSTAGYVFGNSNTIDVNWTPGFTGQVLLYLNGVNQCGNGPISDSLSIHIMPLPAQPVIIANVPVLSSNYANGNQWFFNGQPIANATDDTLTITQNGYYHIVYTDINGCQSVSDSIQILTIGLYDVSDFYLEAYPNPTSDMVFIKYSGVILDQISIQDYLGNEIIHIYKPESFISVDLRHIPTGVYFIRFFYNDAMIIKKQIKL